MSVRRPLTLSYMYVIVVLLAMLIKIGPKGMENLLHEILHNIY